MNKDIPVRMAYDHGFWRPKNASMQVVERFAKLPEL
jgi:hypothetical protein